MRVLLINPYIYDVSAYSFWSSPLGLLYMGGIMRMNGAEVELLDCLVVDRSKEQADGRAPFLKEKVDNPVVVSGIRRRFRRYGLSPEAVSARLTAMTETPDLVLITCGMTYWYLGTKETIELVRRVFPKTKIVLGGGYASLCHEHACREMQGADLVVGNSETQQLYGFVEEVWRCRLSFKPDPADLNALPYPCFDLYEDCRFIALLTSVGCPYRCSYCATEYLQPRVVRRRVEDVIGEMCHWHRSGMERFVLYDDSFLFQRESYAKPLLGAIANLPFNVSIYNPNALNASMIDRETARLLRKAGFKEIRLGFETSDVELQQKMGGKVRTGDLEAAAGNLKDEGFEPENIGVYVLTGLPGQGHESVHRTVDYLAGLELRIHLAQYSPIPHTYLYEKHKDQAKFPLEEPMFQNNVLFPFEWKGFTGDDLNRLKAEVRRHNGRLRTGHDLNPWPTVYFSK